MLRTPTKKSGIGSKFSPSPSSPPVRLVRVLLHEHLARLGERERHHREGDPADAEADRAEHERHDDAGHGDDEQRLGHPLPLRQRDRGQVDAEREVERMPEREQAGEAEEEVVRERDAREDEAEREQPERAGAVERAAEDHGNVEREQRHDREAASRRSGTRTGRTRLNAPPSGEPLGLEQQHDREQEHDREVAEPARGVVVGVLLDQPDRDRRRPPCRRSSRSRRSRRR